MNTPPIINNKIKVNFFQRRPHPGFSFSIEFIFNDIRKRLADRIDARIYISKHYNTGYYRKLINIIEAAFRQRNDINHITGEVHFLNSLMRRRTALLTIHDCGMLARKTGFAKKVMKWLYLSMPIKKASLIITVSETTKQEIIKYTGCGPDKIRVIPVAIDSIYQPKPKTFNKEKPVILHIGTSFNKNLLSLIEAVKNIDCHLAIVGELTVEQVNTLAENKIDYSNEYNISTERLLEKYEECDLLSFVSLHEGFGMPIVEANAIERVVVTSNVSSMPEVAGDAALLVDPYSVEDIRSGIMRIIKDDTLRQTLIDNGKINKLRFDGDKIADQYFELYKEIYHN